MFKRLTAASTSIVRAAKTRPVLEQLEGRRLLSAGDLDSTFGAGGRVITDFGGTNDLGRQVVAGPDGKVIVVGSTGSTSSTTRTNFALARYNSDGSLDTSFGDGGKVVTDFNSNFDLGLSLVIQPDGKVVAAGVSGPSGTNFALARYNSDGTLDEGFGLNGTGKIISSIPSNTTASVGIQSSGRIVLGGTSNGNFAVQRYTTSGILDSTFGINGTRITDLGGFDSLNSIAIQADGRIVAGGATGSSANVAVVRYTANGALDNTFNGNGRLITNFGGLLHSAQGVAVQSDGKIVAAGVVITNTFNENIALLRLNSNGTLDTSFDGDGKVTTDFGGGDSAMSVLVQADGRIVAGGTITGGGFGLARYNGDGSIDSTFGNGGRVNTSFAGSASAFSVALQPDGKILAAGQVGTNPNLNFGLARYISISNTAPVAAGGSFSVDEDATVSGNVTASDADGNSLSFSVVAEPAHGTVEFNVDGSFTYTPGANFNGTDSFSFLASDGQAQSNVATVNLTVLPVNDAPTAQAAGVSVSEDGSAAVAIGGDDVETPADQLVFKIVSLPASGTLTYQGAAVSAGDTFTGSPSDLVYHTGAASDVAVSDSFSFTVSDGGDGASAPLTTQANVEISIDRQEAGSVTVADGILRITGTDADDSITVTNEGEHLEVVLNGQTVSNSVLASEVNEIRIWGRGGNDVISALDLAVGTFMHGGAGEDQITGGGGDNVLLGGAGADQLVGGSGNDFLVGGDGSDRLVGSSGHDVLTAGDIADHFTVAALRAASAAWAADKTVSPDEGGSGDEVVSEGDFDRLTGSAGADWFIISTGDKITDLHQDAHRQGDVVTLVN
jgi:uncharacterized delta-60 repeat protein